MWLSDRQILRVASLDPIMCISSKRGNTLRETWRIEHLGFFKDIGSLPGISFTRSVVNPAGKKFFWGNIVFKEGFRICYFIYSMDFLWENKGGKKTFICLVNFKCALKKSNNRDFSSQQVFAEKNWTRIFLFTKNVVQN